VDFARKKEELPNPIAVDYHRRKETRRITSIGYNTNREPTVSWESESCSGVCMVDVWKKWHATGVDRY